MSKRACSNDDAAVNDCRGVTKKFKTSSDERLSKFLDWMKAEGFKLYNVSVTNQNVASGWGMVADDDIKEGDVLFSIPRSVFLHPANVGRDLKEAIVDAGDELDSGSGWVPLLLCLLYEYNKQESRWEPYFQMVPDYDELHLPMMWSSEELNEELRGTGLLKMLDRDIKSITFEFQSIVIPFIRKHPHLFNSNDITLHHFKKMVSFVMAYSFTEPKKNRNNINNEDDDDDDDDDDEDNDDDDVHPPMMVPLADILNHISDNNAFISFKPQSLEMIAKKDIKKGEEIYNTYGELSNMQLLHMYGYAERPNEALYDTVDIPMTDLLTILHQMNNNSNNTITANSDNDGSDSNDNDHCVSGSLNSRSDHNGSFVNKKWNYLTKLGYTSNDGSFVLGREGILTEKMMNCTMKVMRMKEETYDEFVKNEGLKCYDDEEEEEDDEDDYSLLFEKMSKLPDDYKQVLNRLAQMQQAKYPRSLEDEEELMLKLEKSKAELKQNQQQQQQQIQQQQHTHKTNSNPSQETDPMIKSSEQKMINIKLNSCYVRCGQLRLLQQLLRSTSCN